MRAEIKRCWSEVFPDAQSLPQDPDDCCVAMQAEIGPVGEEGGDTFSFEVCTPSGLARRFDSERRPFWARATLIVGTFSGEGVEAALSQYVHSVSGEDWQDVATKLNRILDWEFESDQRYDGA
jgi:Immunity protein 8